jgi:two-component system sensor histidine kinase HydH
LELDAHIKPISADPDVLSQVFINLIRNALAAMTDGGTLKIKTFETDQTLHIDFENELDRVKSIKQELLFLPFDEGGESISLPLCYQLLKNMGGLLSFVGREHGVVFTVSLPKTAMDTG